MLHLGPAGYTLRNKATQEEEREEREVFGLLDKLCQMGMHQGAQAGSIAPIVVLGIGAGRQGYPR